MKDWLILLCIGFIAFGVYHERERWMPHAGAINVVAPAPPPPPAPAANAPPPPATGARVDSTPPRPVDPDFANRVAASRRMALAKYPALGRLGEEINSRFVFRYKLMVSENSPRLQDPDWPMQLADECAAAARVTAGKPSPASPVPAATLGRRGNSTPPPPLSTVKVAQFTSSAAPAAGPNAGQSGGPLPFITLGAVNESSGNDYTYHWRTDWGAYDISFRQTVGVSVDVRNMGRAPAQLNLRWVFFARKSIGNQRFVFAADTKLVDLAAGETLHLPVASPMIQSREENYAFLGERYLSGSKYEGWLVQVAARDSDQVIKQTGSTSYLEDLTKRSDFASLIADYSKQVGPR